VNQNANTGDTTYSFNNSTVRKTLWDASGSDTLDLTAMTDPVTIYLTYLYSEADLGIEYGHIIQNPETVSQKWHHLLGEYETVSCGSGDDVIFGDENANILSGGAGDDFIAGYEENDILYGGSGEDFFMLAAGHGQDIIKDFDLGVDTCGFWNGSNYDTSLATLSSDINGDAIYHLADGSSLLLEGVLHADIASIA
jgi:Ca2+-binding RTX toxin-like protein